MQSLTRTAWRRVLGDMNDRVWTMRPCGLLLLVVGCAADPTLAITVHHPPSYAVKQTVVTVYVGNDINCGQIAYGDRTALELAAITAEEVDVSAGGSVQVSRLGGKSIVARGYDAQQRFVTAGCKDVGEIAGATSVTIDTQATAVVAIDPAQPDRPFSERTILVNMTDIAGVPLDGNVSWQLTGPAGAIEQPPAAGIATRNGDAKIHVEDLGTPGPEGLRIRVPWATSPLPLVTGFDLSHATTIQLGGGAIAAHVSCDMRGHAGKPPTLVCLTSANVQGHRDAVEIAWQNGQFMATPIVINGQDNEFALFVDHDGSVDEPVYVLGANATGIGYWYNLFTKAVVSPIAFGDVLQNVVYIPKCKDNAVSALVGVQVGTALVQNKLRFFTPAGTAVGTPQDGELFSGGCVGDVDKHEHQAIVASGATGDPALVLLTGAGQQPIATTKLTGSGFIAVETQGVIERRFAGTRLQASGTVVFEAVLAPEGSAFKLVERTEVDTAGPPNKIVAGKLDQDGDTDLMWDMTGVLRRRLFQVSLAKQVDGGPLTAITSGPAPSTAATASDFVVGDLDGQHTDEIVVIAGGSVTIYSAD